MIHKYSYAFSYISNICIIQKNLNIVNIFTYFYRDYEAFRKVSVISSLLEILWDAPALGLKIVTGSPIAYITVSILPALFAGIAYYCGAKEFSLFGVPKNR